MRKSQFNSLNYVINSTFREVFDARSQDVVDICLEMFNCGLAEQTVGMRIRRHFRKELGILVTYCVRHLLLKPQKHWLLYKVLSIS